MQVWFIGLYNRESFLFRVQGGLDSVSFLSLNAVVQHENCSDNVICDASFCMMFSRFTADKD